MNRSGNDNHGHHVQNPGHDAVLAKKRGITEEPRKREGSERGSHEEPQFGTGYQDESPAGFPKVPVVGHHTPRPLAEACQKDGLCITTAHQKPQKGML